MVAGARVAEIVPAAAAGGSKARERDIQDTRQLPDLLLEESGIFQCIGIFYHQHLGAIEPEVPALDIMQLMVYDQGADDEEDGDGKLENDQEAAEPAAFKTCGKRTSSELRSSLLPRSQPSVPSVVF